MAITHQRFLKLLYYDESNGKIQEKNYFAYRLASFYVKKTHPLEKGGVMNNYENQMAMAKNIANLKLNSTKKLQVNLLLASLLKTLKKGVS